MEATPGDLFLAASLEDKGWETALRSMAAATRSQSGQIIGFSQNGGLIFNIITDHARDVVDRFERDEGSYSRAQNWRVAASGPPLAVRHEAHYAATRAGRKTDMYDDMVWAADQPHGCQTVLIEQPDATVGLALLRSRRDGPTGEHDREGFARIMPYALAAARMQRALEEESGRLLIGSLEGMDKPAFLCDRTGKVQALTRAADKLVSSGEMIALRKGQLVAANPNEDLQLQRAMAVMLARATPQVIHQSLWLGTNGALRTHCLCELFALPQRDHNFGFAPKILVTVRAARNFNARDQAELRRAFDLTVAEAEVATMLSNGMPREEVAMTRETSMSTVTSQVKHIFTKTGVGREAELVALVHRLLR